MRKMFRLHGANRELQILLPSKLTATELKQLCSAEVEEAQSSRPGFTRLTAQAPLPRILRPKSTEWVRCTCTQYIDYSAAAPVLAEEIERLKNAAITYAQAAAVNPDKIAAFLLHPGRCSECR